MLLKTEPTNLESVLLLHPQGFEDHRGEYVETYNEEEYRKAGVDIRFLQDDYSVSTKHVLRGLHGDDHTWKLVFCTWGKFYLVVMDAREEAPTFGKWQAFVLSDRNHRQVLIPPRFANGHLVLSDQALFSYKQSAYYDPQGQFSYRWNDERFQIWWPVQSPILSRRDEAGCYVS